MIKPYYKGEHTAKIVEVEEYGTIDLTKLPIRLEREGVFEIGWVTEYPENVQVLSEYGGRSMMDYGGRHLGVIKEIE